MEQLAGSRAAHARRQRRGLPGQRPLRELEREVRRRAAAFVHERSLSLREAAELLDLAPSTLADWSGLEGKVPALGRPPSRGTREQREAVLSSVEQLGLHTGAPRLRALHPELSRGEVRELLRRRRTVASSRPPAPACALEWLVPGAAWATDFTRIPASLTPLCSAVSPLALVVRDLASGFVLAAVPAQSESEEVVREVLSLLFAVHGAPLVLKSDNGSGYVAAGSRGLCARHGVLGLFSPPRTPAYNGSVEASNTWLKRDLEHLAAREHAPLEALLEVARERRNATGRPWGARGQTPAQRWEARAAISAEVRARVTAAYTRAEAHARAERGIGPQALPRLEQASVDREAMSRALVEHGILVIRGRRISL